MKTIKGNHVEFDFTIHEQTVCPHCQSGFVIISVGVTDGLITQAAIFTPESSTVPFYCPWCGGNMVIETKNA